MSQVLAVMFRDAKTARDMFPDTLGKTTPSFAGRTLGRIADTPEARSKLAEGKRIGLVHCYIAEASEPPTHADPLMTAINEIERLREVIHAVQLAVDRGASTADAKLQAVRVVLLLAFKT